MTTPSIEAIAAGLSEAQRQSLASHPDGDRAWSATHSWPVFREKLQALGLMERTNQNEWLPTTRLTPLGLAVRAHLGDPA